LTISEALKTELQRQGSQPLLAAEFYPKRVDLDLPESYIDLEFQSESVFNRASSSGVAGFLQDETSASGVTRFAFGNSTWFATELDGSGQIELGEGIGYSINLSIVIEFQISYLSGNQHIFGVYTTAGSGDTQDKLRIAVGSSGEITVGLQGSVATTAGVVSSGEWHRLVVVLDGNGLGQTNTFIYLDGTELTGGGVLLGDEVGAVFGSGFVTVLGADRDGTSYNERFAGRIGRLIITDDIYDQSDVDDFTTALSSPLICVSGDTPILDYANNLSGASPVSRKTHPVTRKVSGSDRIELSLADDGWARDLFKAYRPDSTGVALKLGAANVDPDDWLLFHIGVVSEILPREEAYGVTVRDPTRLLKERNTGPGIFIGHPGEIVQQVLDHIGLPRAYYDRESLAFDANAATSHHQLIYSGQEPNHHRFGAIGQGEKNSTELINGITELTNTSFAPGPLGRFTFRSYDPTASTVKDWGQDDILNLEPVSTLEHLTNKVVLKGHYTDGPEKGPIVSIVAEDEQSQEDHQVSGQYNREVSATEIDTKWMNARLIMLDGADHPTDLSGAGPTWIIDGAATPGFCGAGLAFDQRQGPTGVQGSGYDLDSGSDRYLYVFVPFLLEDPEGPGEIMRVSEITGYPDWSTYWDPGFPRPNIPGNFPYFLRLEVDAREVLGTQRVPSPLDTASALKHRFAFDCTLFVDRAQAILDRFSNGAPVMRCRTTLSEMDVNQGDFVTITDGVYSNYGHDGIDIDTVWEVTGKEVDVLGDSPGITWTLVFVRTLSAPSATATAGTQTNHVRSSAAAAVQTLASEAAAPVRVGKLTEFAITTPGGFDYEIDTGTVGRFFDDYREVGELSSSAQASKDTYVYADAFLGRTIVKVVNNGAGDPVVDPFAAPLWKIVTDGSGITSTEDLRTTKSLADDTVDIGAIQNAKRGATTTSDATATTAVEHTLETDKAYTFEARVVCKEDGGDERNSFLITCHAARGSTAVAVLSNPHQLYKACDNSMAATFDVTGAGDGIRVLVTGLAGTTIDWEVNLRWVEVDAPTTGTPAACTAFDNSALPVPAQLGQILYASTSSAYVASVPTVTEDGFLVTTEEGFLVTT